MAEIIKRKNKSGKQAFRVTFRKKGIPPIYKTFETEEEAKNFIEALEKSLKKNSSEIPPFPLKIWISRYKSEILPTKTKKMQQSESRYLSFWENNFGNEIAIDLSPLKIELCANTIYKIKSVHSDKFLTPTSRHHYLKCLSYLFNTAIKKWNWAKENPVQKVDLHLEKIKEHQNKLKEHNEEKEFWLITKREFVKACKQQIDKNKYKTLDLKNLTGLQKTTLQRLLDPDHNSTLQGMLTLANALGVKIEIK